MRFKRIDLLTYRYNYDLSEYIDLANYKGLPAEGYTVNITDEDIQQQILATRSYVLEADRHNRPRRCRIRATHCSIDDTVRSMDWRDCIRGYGKRRGSYDRRGLLMPGVNLKTSSPEQKIGDTLSFDMPTFPKPHIPVPRLIRRQRSL